MLVLCLANFTYHNILHVVHSHWHKWQNFFLFKGWITFHLCIYPFFSRWTFRLPPCLGLLGLMLQWTWKCRYLFEILISIHLDMYQDVGLLDHMIVLFLTFWGIFLLYSIVVEPIYVPSIEYTVPFSSRVHPPCLSFLKKTRNYPSICCSDISLWIFFFW